jgi:hypothetical protein
MECPGFEKTHHSPRSSSPLLVAGVCPTAQMRRKAPHLSDDCLHHGLVKVRFQNHDETLSTVQKKIISRSGM